MTMSAARQRWRWTVPEANRTATPEKRNVDVAVVGAGISGLICATLLRDAGVSVAVVEARDRVGGRTLSETVTAGGREARFDLGGQWIGPQQKRMLRLSKDLGIETFPTFEDGKTILDIGGRRYEYKGMIPRLSVFKLGSMQTALMKVDRLAKKINVESPIRSPGAARFDATTLADWRRRNVRASDVREIMDAGLRIVFGSEPDELSFLAVLYYVKQACGVRPMLDTGGGAQETRFVDGAQEVSLRLAASLGDSVNLECPVETISQSDSGVEVRTTRGTFVARYAIVATPPTMAGRIRFDPPLPPDRDQLMQRMPIGATTKFQAIYEQPFWRDRGFSGSALWTRGPVTVVFDNTSHDGEIGCLLGFSVGQPARDLARLSEADRRGVVLATFENAFGPEASEPVEFREKDWQADEWARGCPTGIFPPGVLGQFGDALCAPCGRVHWAGTETAREWTGYMEGAVEAAERAAGEVEAKLAGD